MHWHWQTFHKILFKEDFSKPGPLKDALDSLFGSADYLSGVGAVCAGKPVLDPFQISIMYGPLLSTLCSRSS